MAETTRSTAPAIAGLLLLAGMLPAPPTANAESPLSAMQAIADTRLHIVQSEILEREFKLLVRTPAAYADRSTGRLPVVYLLDGGATFPMLAGYYNYLRFEEAVPDLVIVGISYGADSFEDGNFRSTDYTAPSTERDFWGGAPQFDEVLAREILPYIESRYRVDPEQRILFGQSLGGQFVLFAASNHPSLFRGYIASNPALHRNLDYFLAVKPPEGAPGPRLFVASGSDDVPEFREPALAWIKKWNAAPQKPWALKAVTIDGYGHFSLAPESFRQGLLWTLFGR